MRPEAEAKTLDDSPAGGADGAATPDKAKRAVRRGSGRPTIADVASRAGVGAITVSRALRQPERVSPALRRQIAAAVEELGYVPDPAARALASAQADVIGVLVPSLTNNVFAEVLRGIHDGLGGAALQIQFGNTHYSRREEERLLRLFLRQRPTAMIVSGIDQTPTAKTLLEEAGCPVVQIMETGPKPIDMMVGFSHRAGGRAVARHLIEAGYRRIGFLGARMDPRSQRRLQGYREAMQAADLLDPRLETTTAAPSSVAIGGELFRAALDKTPDLDAVFCNNDDLAVGVLFACHRAGLAVPARIGIAGFNDLEMMAVACPSLTSLRTHRYMIGRRAIALAQAAVGGERPERRVIDIGFELMARESTMRRG